MKPLLTTLALALAAAVASADQHETAEAAPAQQQLPVLEDATILAASFPIEVFGDLGGLKIAVEAGDTGADAYVKLANEGDVGARCNLLFKNGPESRRRASTVDPGASRMVLGGLRRNVVNLRIHLTCAPAS